MSLRTSRAVRVADRAGRVSHEDLGRAHRADALLGWGSVSKVMVAAVARALVADGALAWTTTVTQLTGVAAPGWLTLEALVEHRSGLPRLVPEQARMIRDPYGPFTDARFDDEVVPRLGELAPAVPTDPEYSNLGYAVLTRAIERSQGTPWLELLRDLVVRPAGLAREAVTLTPGADAVRARGLRGNVLEEWDLSTGPFSGAGGLWASIETMSALARTALDPGSLLDPLSGRTAWVDDRPRFWHNGATLRSGGIVVVDVDAGTVTAAHTVGGLPTSNATQAEKLVADLLMAQGRRRPGGPA